MKAFLDNFAAILGAATVALLLMSVSHEYGYFWAVGRHFQTFLTTSDYFSNAVLWLPAALLILYGFLDWDILLGKGRYKPIGLNFGGALLALMVAALLVSFFFAPSLSPYSVLPFIILWMLYGIKLLPLQDANSELLIYTRRILIIAPVVMVVLFAWGFAQGESDLKSFDDPYTLEMKKGENLRRIILRTFDKGILVRDAVESRIDFVKWDEVIKISRLAVSSRQPLSCSWIGINCSTFPAP